MELGIYDVFQRRRRGKRVTGRHFALSVDRFGARLGGRCSTFNAGPSSSLPKGSISRGAGLLSKAGFAPSRSGEGRKRSALHGLYPDFIYHNPTIDTSAPLFRALSTAPSTSVIQAASSCSGLSPRSSRKYMFRKGVASSDGLRSMRAMGIANVLIMDGK